VLAQFTQQGAKLVGTDSVGAPYQGQSVTLSADGNTAIVGGPADTPGRVCGCHPVRVRRETLAASSLIRRRAAPDAQNRDGRRRRGAVHGPQSGLF
jgi:hypothetical protein